MENVWNVTTSVVTMAEMVSRPKTIPLLAVVIAFSGLVAALGSIVIYVVLGQVKITTDSQMILLKILAITDFAIGVVLVLSVLQQNVGALESEVSCKVLLLCLSIGNAITTFTLAFVALDKLLTILRPLRHQRLITPSRIVAVESSSALCQTVWMAWVFSGERFLDKVVYTPEFSLCVPFFGNPDKVALVVTTGILWIVLPIVLTMGCYLWIGIIARKQNRKIAASFGDGVTTKQLRRKEWKGIRIAVWITMIFLLAWIPGSVISLLQSISLITIPNYVKLIATFMTFTNAWCNILLYFLFYKSFREKVVQNCKDIYYKLRFFNQS